MTFARFMELALYHPGAGYYASHAERIGPAGDYYTSPTAHPAFAALLALQLEQMWQALGQPTPFTVVEIGGGKGLLARDLTAYAQHLSPGFSQALDYVLIEYYATPEVLPPQVRAYATPEGLSGVTGCFISNEFFDSLPVHRVAQVEGQLKEVYVTLGRDGGLVEELGEPSTPEIEAYFQRVGTPLPQDCQAEVNLGAPHWLARMAESLVRGYIITIDYGDTAPEIFSARRPRGTLMCYYHHTATEDPYQHLGEQDITALVDFTTVVRAGEASGMLTLGLVPQGSFLWNLGLPVFIQGLSLLHMPQSEYYANLMALRDLARPDGLGDFRVLVQGKGTPHSPLDGLASGQGPRPNWGRVAQLPVPRLDQRHIPLLRARYPHLAGDLEPGLE